MLKSSAVRSAQSRFKFTLLAAGLSVRGPWADCWTFPCPPAAVRKAWVSSTVANANLTNDASNSCLCNPRAGREVADSRAEKAQCLLPILELPLAVPLRIDLQLRGSFAQVMQICVVTRAGALRRGVCAGACGRARARVCVHVWCLSASVRACARVHACMCARARVCLVSVRVRVRARVCVRARVRARV